VDGVLPGDQEQGSENGSKGHPQEDQPLKYCPDIFSHRDTPDLIPIVESRLTLLNRLKPRLLKVPDLIPIVELRLKP
jgi:hypothetical protein